MKPLHLVRRFFGALSWRRPRADDLAWVERVLLPGELVLFRRLPNHDQRHLVKVARRVEAELSDTAEAGDSRWLAAALLHDVGKYDARLGPYGRAIATVCGWLGGHDMARAWTQRRGFTRRVGLYLLHGELGADMIRLAGGREEAATWAAAGESPDAWARTGIPAVVVAALAAADDA